MMYRDQSLRIVVYGVKIVLIRFHIYCGV